MPNAILSGKEFSENRAVFYTIFSSVLGSFGGMLTRYLPWNPVVLFGLRAGTCALALIVYMRGFKHFIYDKDTIFGSLIVTVAGLLYIIALRFTTVANASILKFTSPIWVLLIARILYKERFRRRDYLAVLLAFGGVVLFFADRLDFTQMIGNIVGLGSGILMGFQLVLYGRHGSTRKTMSAMFLAQPWGLLISLPFIFFVDPPEWSWARLGILLLVGVVSLAIPNILYSFSSPFCSPLKIGLIRLIEPLLSPVWAFVFLRELPGPFAIAGGVVVVSVITVWSLLGARQSERDRHELAALKAQEAIEQSTSSEDS